MPIKKETKTRLLISPEETIAVLKDSKLPLEEYAQQFLTLYGSTNTGYALSQPLATTIYSGEAGLEYSKELQGIATPLPDGEYTTAEGVDVVVENGNLEVRTNDSNVPESTVDMPYPAPQLTIEEQKVFNEALFWKTQKRVSKYIKARHPNTTDTAIAKRRAANKAAGKARRR